MKKFFYRAEQGDTVFSLSVKFEVSPCSIIKENSLKSEIEAGDLLYIVQNGERTHAVQPFERIEELAERYNTTPERLLEKNGVPYIFFGLIIEV